jgi:hypothetical protein
MRKTPYLFKSKEDITTESIRKIPLLNTKDINGFEFIKSYFVDSSGFGDENEPALTFSNFFKEIKTGYAYGIIEAGQFQVYIGEFKPNNNIKTNNEELKVVYDRAKSFYNKAMLIKEGDVLKLQSYQTIVAQIENNKPKVFGSYSLTTMRHIKEFLKQNGFKATDTKQILKDYLIKD